MRRRLRRLRLGTPFSRFTAPASTPIWHVLSDHAWSPRGLRRQRRRRRRLKLQGCSLRRCQAHQSAAFVADGTCRRYDRARCQSRTGDGTDRRRAQAAWLLRRAANGGLDPGVAPGDGAVQPPCRPEAGHSSRQPRFSRCHAGKADAGLPAAMQPWFQGLGRCLRQDCLSAWLRPGQWRMRAPAAVARRRPPALATAEPCGATGAKGSRGPRFGCLRPDRMHPGSERLPQ